MGAFVASITALRLMAGSGRLSVMTPCTENPITVDTPGALELAAWMAALSEPGPELFRLVTVMDRDEAATACMPPARAAASVAGMARSKAGIQAATVIRGRILDTTWIMHPVVAR
ncbi:MAG TPA: hypothetical protein VIX86_15660 [Streptosporangiaceae bacterium]